GYSADDIARGRALKAKAAPETTLLDVAAAREAVAGAGKVGIVGYCWGGSVTWMAACREAELACAVPYYVVALLEARKAKPKCPVMSHFGERDAHIPVDGVRRFAQAHPEVQVFIYAADHGFNCDQRGSYDAAAAKLARERTVAFLHKHIG